jgi:hypothetical protein
MIQYRTVEEVIEEWKKCFLHLSAFLINKEEIEEAFNDFNSPEFGTLSY